MRISLASQEAKSQGLGRSSSLILPTQAKSGNRLNSKEEMSRSLHV